VKEDGRRIVRLLEPAATAGGRHIYTRCLSGSTVPQSGQSGPTFCCDMADESVAMASRRSKSNSGTSSQVQRPPASTATSLVQAGAQHVLPAVRGGRQRRGGRRILRWQVAARASDVLAVVRQLQAEGASSLRAIATALHKGVQTPAGKEEWSAAQVRRLLAHAGPGHGLGSPALPPPP
jgi:hypothetical protein